MYYSGGMILRPYASKTTAQSTAVVSVSNKKKKAAAVAILSLSFLSFILLYKFQGFREIRSLWTYDADTGACAWQEAVEPSINPNNPLYGTLFASYPGGGMRATWTQAEGLSGMAVGDDFFKINQRKRGMIKTQYPHFEGIWSYDDYMDQVVLIVSNPLWAIPSYHTLLAELDYAHTWQIAYQVARKGFTERPPVEDWIKWRDYRFDDEIMLWGYHIDFWMGNGTQYWMDMDFERNGQWPFRFLNESEKPWPQALPCKFYLECAPKAVVSYEQLSSNLETGVAEIRKIANVLRDKPGMDIIPDEALECIYNETKSATLYNTDDDRTGPPAHYYNFSIPQMVKIQNKLVEYRDKYSTAPWTDNPLAADLVTNFQNYLGVVGEALDAAYLNPPPTPSPDPQYLYNITQWYSSLGRGNRYTKDRVQAMGLWDLVKHFY